MSLKLRENMLIYVKIYVNFLELLTLQLLNQCLSQILETQNYVYSSKEDFFFSNCSMKLGFKIDIYLFISKLILLVALKS